MLSADKHVNEEYALLDIANVLFRGQSFFDRGHEIGQRNSVSTPGVADKCIHFPKKRGARLPECEGDVRNSYTMSARIGKGPLGLL